MDKYLWHSSSLRLLGDFNLLSNISLINGEHYVTPITKDICKNLPNINLLLNYSIDREALEPILKDNIKYLIDISSQEDKLLFCLLEHNSDFKVIVLGSGVMAKFDAKLHSRRVKLFDVLIKYDDFKHRDIAKILSKADEYAEKNFLGVQLYNDKSFNLIKNIALGQQQG